MNCSRSSTKRYARAAFTLSFLSISVGFAQPNSAALRTLFEQVYEEWRALSPSTRELKSGRIELTGLWPELTAESREKRWQLYTRQLADLRRLDPSGDPLNYRLLEDELERRIRRAAFPNDLLLVNSTPWVSMLGSITGTLTNAPAASLRDYENLLTQMRGVPKVVDQMIERLDEGLQRGITPPKIVLRDLPAQLDALAAGSPAEHPYLELFRVFPSSVTPADQERLRREAAAIADSALMPAMRKLRRYAADTYIPQSRETIARSRLPNGATWYETDIEEHTTTRMTAREIHELGLAEVRRIRAEMDKIIAQVGWTNGFAAFQEHLRKDSRFYFIDSGEYLRSYRDLCKRIDAELPKLFKRLPRAPYGVRAIPAFSAPSASTAYYTRAPRDGSGPGWFNVNLYKLDERPRFEMEALAIHEAVPGHHLQIALANEIEDQPKFRRSLSVNAYTEGWALYTESLGEQLGLYRDPYSKFGQLSYDMWRACRLVVDPGMHVFGWTRDRAIAFMKDNTALTEQNIVAEIDRYIIWPGQALAYKVGEQRIKALRREAEAALGDKFDVREFHDAILRQGAVPLTVLESQIRAWIKTQATASSSADAGERRR